MISSGLLKYRRSLLSGMVLRPLGYSYWGAEQTASSIKISGGSCQQVLFSEMSGLARIKKRFGFTLVIFSLKETAEVEIAGLKHEEATNLTSVANSALCQYVAHILATSEQELRILVKAVKHLEQPRHYPSGCLIEPFMTRATKVINALPETIPTAALTHEQQTLLDIVLEFQKAPEFARSSAIKTFIKNELVVMNYFFDKTESNPLTPEQRLAVITDEDAALMILNMPSY